MREIEFKSIKTKVPCQNCSERWVDGAENCHMYCDAYKLYEQERNANYDYRIEMSNFKMLNQAISDSTYRRLTRNKNTRGER